MLAAQTSAYDTLLSIGPFFALAIFVVVYYVVMFKMYRGPGKMSKLLLPPLFIMFGYLANPGTTLANLVPQIINALFGNHFKING